MIISGYSSVRESSADPKMSESVGSKLNEALDPRDITVENYTQYIELVRDNINSAIKRLSKSKVDLEDSDKADDLSSAYSTLSSVLGNYSILLDLESRMSFAKRGEDSLTTISRLVYDSEEALQLAKKV